MREPTHPRDSVSCEVQVLAFLTSLQVVAAAASGPGTSQLSVDLRATLRPLCEPLGEREGGQQDPGVGHSWEHSLGRGVSLKLEKSMWGWALLRCQSCSQGHHITGFPGGSDGKESACNAGDLGLIPGSERSPGEGNDNPLQYSCLENSMDRGAW